MNYFLTRVREIVINILICLYEIKIQIVDEYTYSLKLFG